MFQTVIVLLMLSCLYTGYSQLTSLRRNILAAKASGFDYVVLPVYIFSVAAWFLSRPLIGPLVKVLPTSWTDKWIPLIGIERIWHYGYEPFERIGSDTFIAVSPGGNILFTCHPQVSSQLLAGRVFNKPAKKIVPMLNLFGPTITGTDDDESRIYRKITAPFFNTQTVQRVWDESISCVETWMEHLAIDQAPDSNLRHVLEKINLHIIRAVGFGVSAGKFSLTEESLPENHDLTFSQAVLGLLKSYMTIFLMPEPILKRSPFDSHKQAFQSFNELRKYMKEMKERKQQEIRSGLQGKEPNLLDLLVQAGEPAADGTRPLISEDAILGNIFIFLFAGHEANVNTILFLTILLASYPSIQRKMQTDIDRITGGSSILSYDEHYKMLSNGMVGAVINETLRLYTVVPILFKGTRETLQYVKLNGESHTIPPNTITFINKSAAHRNPRNWSTTRPKSAFAGSPSALGDFNPEQWFVQDKETGTTTFLNPESGSYMPFSDGGRGCLGKSFGQAELCAFVTRLFKDYTAELVVPGDSNNDELIKEQWYQERSRVEKEMSSGVEFVMSLRLGGKVPIRFVKRGKENFTNVIE